MLTIQIFSSIGMSGRYIEALEIAVDCRSEQTLEIGRPNISANISNMGGGLLLPMQLAKVEDMNGNLFSKLSVSFIVLIQRLKILLSLTIGEACDHSPSQGLQHKLLDSIDLGRLHYTENRVQYMKIQ